MLLVVGGVPTEIAGRSVEVFDLLNPQDTSCTARNLSEAVFDHRLVTLEDAPLYCGGWQEK